MECQKKTHHSVGTCTYFHKHGKHAEVTPPHAMVLLGIFPIELFRFLFWGESVPTLRANGYFSIVASDHKCTKFGLGDASNQFG